MTVQDIETPRLLLVQNYRPVKEHIKWLNDAELMRWSEQRWVGHDWETQRRFLDKAQMDGNPLVWDIRMKIENPNPAPSADYGLRDLFPTIGSLHAYINDRHCRADLGIMIGPEFGRKGYGKEAWQAVCDYLRTVRGIEKFEAGCVNGNVGMVKILHARGWRVEGRRKRHFIIDGVRYDLILWGAP